MLIQNVSVDPAPQPARLASDGASGGVVVQPSSAGVRLGVAAGLTQAVSQPPSPEQLQNAVDSINQAMRQSSQNLEFSVDRDTNKQVVKMVDAKTGDLIRQIPSEETLAIARSIDQFMQRQGLLLSQKA